MELIDLLLELKHYIKKRANTEQIRDLCEIILSEAKKENLRIARGAKFLLTKTEKGILNYDVAEREINNMISVIENRTRL